MSRCQVMIRRKAQINRQLGLVSSFLILLPPTTLRLNRVFFLRRNSTMASSRWIRPEVYPLFAAMGVAVGICGFQLIRNICINPEVRVNKQNRAAGILDNFAEGEKYTEHFLRKFVRNKPTEIMPSINKFFTDPNRN